MRGRGKLTPPPHPLSPSGSHKMWSWLALSSCRVRLFIWIAVRAGKRESVSGDREREWGALRVEWGSCSHLKLEPSDRDGYQPLPASSRPKRKSHAVYTCIQHSSFLPSGSTGPSNLPFKYHVVLPTLNMNRL